jgi:carboxymethylenebutenolidase
MKKQILKIQVAFAFIASTFFTSTTLFAQHSCCQKPGSTETFAMLTTDEQFVATHLDPNPYTLENPLGKDIEFAVAGGMNGHAYELKAAKPTNNYVLVIHEWWGLNDYIKKESERIFNQLGNFNVIAIDLYDGKVAAVKDSAAKYMQSVQTDRAVGIVNGVLKHIGKKAKVATIGWCFGGGWSMQTALLAGKNAKACVMYYGMPEENVERIKTLKAPVYFVWPTQDQWINKEMVTRFEANMQTAEKSLVVKSYDADHAFANPSNPKFSKAFADDAFQHAIEFIQTNLK